MHKAGGKIFVQLWHVGRMAHPEISGFPNVGPSPIAANLLSRTPTGAKPLPVPRALSVSEIGEIVGQFRAAARRAVDAGIDGVEIHAANGYLLHEFLSDVVNQRTDDYGGSPQNRARFVAEIVEAVAAEIGPERVGLRISPGNPAGDMSEIDQTGAYELLLCRIASLNIAYLHVSVDPSQPAFAAVRTQWDGTLVLNTLRTLDTDFALLEKLADWGVISAAAVGRAFLANPDLVARLAVGAELNVPDPTTFYAPGPAGYIDYPTFDQMATARSA